MYQRAMASVACALLVLAAGASGVVAQDQPVPVGIDALCGDVALEPSTVEATLDPVQTAALDAILRGFVTVPDDMEMILALGAIAPAPGSVVLVETPDGRYFRSIGVADLDVPGQHVGDTPRQEIARTPRLSGDV